MHQKLIQMDFQGTWGSVSAPPILEGIWEDFLEETSLRWKSEGQGYGKHGRQGQKSLPSSRMHIQDIPHG